MDCPNDGTQLLMSERQGIEIDYCPKCRGVWLDRGELDKIIERSDDDDADDYRERGHEPRYREPERYDDRPRHDKRKKPKSFLGDIFDL